MRTPTTDVAVRAGRDVATYDTAEGVIRVPTQVAGVHLTFAPDQRVLNDAQMVLLSPLGVEAGWDPRQVAVFLMECQERGLNPWNREAYLMQYPGGKYVRHIGIDGFRKRGESTGAYRGRVGPYWCDADGAWLEIWPHRDRAPVAAKVGLLRDGFDSPVWAVAMYDEYAATKAIWEGPQGNRRKVGREITEQWRPAADGGKPATMLAKVAEAQAWRVAFPDRFGGFYAPEELDRVRGEQPGGDPAAAKRKAAYAQAQAAAAALPGEVVDASVVDEPEPAGPNLGEADRELLFAELDEQAGVLGRPVADLCERWSSSRGGRTIDTATVAELADHVHRIRPYVVNALRAAGRDVEADRYAQAPPAGTVQELFGRDPAVPEPLAVNVDVDQEPAR